MSSKFLNIAAAVALFATSGTVVHAQEASYPEKCKSMGGDMAAKHEQMMKSSSMEMKDFQKEYMDGMGKTMPLMMEGMMKDDVDVAFVCGMIGHHMGAIEMSKTELKNGDDEQAKQMAQKIIDAQMKEIDEMSKWVEAHAK
jgi:uncharacterized protein (DUF305 family)